MKLRAEIKHIPNSLEEIFSNDDLGLFADVQAPQKKKANSNDPAVNNFLELVEFVHKNGREPKIENSEEKFLAVRLNSYRTRKTLAEKVREYDSIGLLKELSEEPVPAEKKQNCLNRLTIFLPMMIWGFWMMSTAPFIR